jgi:hypothetical protein
MESDKLPHRIQPKAARHYRITLEVTFEKPEIRVDIEFRPDFALAVLTTFVRDQGNTIQHEHVGLWQATVRWSEQLPMATGDQVIVVVGTPTSRKFCR